MYERVCLQCGMSLKAATGYCPKCDNDLEQQTDGSTVTVDIAHHGERVHEAIQKMDRTIETSRSSSAQFLRLVVGGGAIRDEVSMALIATERRGDIKSFQQDDRNPGVIMIRLK